MGNSYGAVLKNKWRTTMVIRNDNFHRDLIMNSVLEEIKRYSHAQVLSS